MPRHERGFLLSSDQLTPADRFTFHKLPTTRVHCFRSALLCLLHQSGNSSYTAQGITIGRLDELLKINRFQYGELSLDT